MFHGLGGNKSALVNTLAGLMDLSKDKIGYSVLLIDLAGHGRSTNLRNIEDYSFTAQSKVFVEIINDEFGERSNFITIGHCYGSFMAVTLTSLFPKRATDLVLVSSNPFQLECRKRLYRLFQNSLTRNFMKLFFKKMSFKKPSGNFDYAAFKNSSDHNIRRLLIDIKSTSLRGYSASVHNLLFSPVDEIFKQLVESGINILMIHGEKDRVFSIKCIRRAAEQRDIKFIGIPGSNHLPVFNAARELAEIIFLEAIMKYGN